MPNDAKPAQPVRDVEGRREQIRALLDEGLEAPEIAARLGFSVRTIRYDLAALQLPAPKRRKKPPAPQPQPLITMQARPAWWHAARRILQYVEACNEIRSESLTGRPWRIALGEMRELADLANEDRLIVQHLAPDDARSEIDAAWPGVTNAFDRLECLLQAASDRKPSQLFTQGPQARVTTMPLKDFAPNDAA